MTNKNIPKKTPNDGLVQARVPKKHIQILQKANVDVAELIRQAIESAVANCLLDK